MAAPAAPAATKPKAAEKPKNETKTKISTKTTKTSAQTKPAQTAPQAAVFDLKLPQAVPADASTSAALLAYIKDPSPLATTRALASLTFDPNTALDLSLSEPGVVLAEKLTAALSPSKFWMYPTSPP